MPRVAIQYASLQYFRPLFLDMGVSQSLSPALAGVCTGVIQAVAVVTPLEVIKCRQQTEKGRGSYRGLVHGARLIVKEEGFAGLYKGLSATIARQAWGVGCKFYGYFLIRDGLTAANGGRWVLCDLSCSLKRV